MKGKIKWVGLLFFVSLISAKPSSADTGPSRPNCPAEWNSNPYQTGLCKVIDKKVSVLTTSKFSANYYFIEEDSNSDTYSLVSDVQGYLSLSGTKLFAVKKDYFDKAGGFEAIFNTTVKKYAPNDEYPEYITIKPKNKNEFKKNFYDVIVDFNNVGDLAWWEPRDISPRIVITKNEHSNMLFPIPSNYTEYPYLVAPVNSPVVGKEFVYSPERLNCYSGSCELVLYKSKEVWTLDNGEKKEYYFTTSEFQPSNGEELLFDENIQSNANQQKLIFEDNSNNSSDMTNNLEKSKQECVTVEKPVKKGFWAKLGCFFNGLVGNKC